MILIEKKLSISKKRRQMRIRRKITGTQERPRLTVFRSNRHIYAQVIDDLKGSTLAAMSTLSAEVREQIKGKKMIEIASIVGAQLAKKCTGKGITKVVFDRNGFLYHGRVKALAEGARKNGLEF